MLPVAPPELHGQPWIRLETLLIANEFYAFGEVFNQGYSIVRVRLLDASGNDVLPIHWNDNFVSLLPGEQRELSATYDDVVPQPKQPLTVRVEGWNITPQTIPPEEYAKKRQYFASNAIGGYPFVGTPDRVADELASISKAGMRGIALSFAFSNAHPFGSTGDWTGRAVVAFGGIWFGLIATGAALALLAIRAAAYSVEYFG